MSDTIKAFTSHGPFPIPLEPNKSGKMIAKDLSEFWTEVGELSKRRGVYLFAVRAGKGTTPVYVGKAAKQDFQSEAFTAHKLASHYNPALLDYSKGTAVMYFVAHPKGKGALNRKLIDAVETFLIDIASAKNPDLSNIRKKTVHKWRIKGVVRANQGEAQAAGAKRLRATLGID